MIDTLEKDSLLEQQLEKIFSDVTPTELANLFGRRLTPQVTTPGPRRIRLRPFIKSALDAITRARWFRPKGTIQSLSALVVTGAVVIAVAFMLMRQVQVGHSSATTPPATVLAMVGEVAPTTAPETPTAIPVSAFISVAHTSTPITLTPTDTPPPATQTPTVTSSPTPIPPTPTLVPVQPVYTATVTAVPISSTGLVAIPTPVPYVPMPEGAINIVLMGSDQRPYETQWRTDVVIVISVNPDQPSVSMLSIPRDTWLYIPNWTRQRINLADVHGSLVGYPGGGPGLVKAAIEYNFGIHVDYFARVNFAGLIKIVDTLGGIDVLLECPVEDGFPDDPITEDPSVVTQVSYPVPGLYHIDGKHALWLSRSRKTTSEFSRSRRQHRVLEGIWAKSNELGLITRLPELWGDLMDTVQTDLSLEQVLWLASIGLKLEPSQVHSGYLDGRHLNAWVSPGGASVLLPKTEAILEYLDLLFNPYPYQAPQGFNQIEVWNGSGREGWGYLAADRLARNGFEVTDVRASDEAYEHSTILDFTSTSKGSPLSLLQRLFDATSAHPGAEEQTNVPFRLIVGADYQPCSWPVGASWAPDMPTPTPRPTPEQ